MISPTQNILEEFTPDGRQEPRRLQTYPYGFVDVKYTFYDEIAQPHILTSGIFPVDAVYAALELIESQHEICTSEAVAVMNSFQTDLCALLSGGGMVIPQTGAIIHWNDTTQLVNDASETPGDFMDELTRRILVSDISITNLIKDRAGPLQLDEPTLRTFMSHHGINTAGFMPIILAPKLIKQISLNPEIFDDTQVPVNSLMKINLPDHIHDYCSRHYASRLFLRDLVLMLSNTLTTRLYTASQDLEFIPKRAQIVRMMILEIALKENLRVE